MRSTRTKRILTHNSDVPAANKIITFDVPGFESISQIFLTFRTGANAPAAMTDILNSIQNIRMTINAVTVLDISAVELVKVYQMLGVQVFQSISSVLPLNIVQLLYKLASIEDAFAIGTDAFREGRAGATARIGNIQVQVTCKGTVTGINNIICSSERFDVGPGLNITRGYCKLITYPQGIKVPGTSVVDKLPQNADEGYLFCAAMYDDGHTVSGECIANSQAIIQKSPRELLNQVLDCRSFGEVTGVLAYMFTDGQPQSMLSMRGITDFRISTEFSTAPTSGFYDMVVATMRSTGLEA